MKSEPDVYSIERLKKEKKTLWEGVRNFQARNFMTNEMSVGDLVLFYHSSCEVPGVAGIARVCTAARPDPSQFNKKGEYFEKRATKDKPVWFCVEIEYVSQFKEVFTLSQARVTKGLEKMLLLKRGQRLSVQPLLREEFEIIKKCSEKIP